MRGVLRRVADFLRISAVRRMLTTMPVTRGEIASLVGLAVLFALFEGAGISLLLPVLQFAESGSTAITDSGSPLWVATRWIVDGLGMSITLATLLTMAFVPILLRQAVFYVNNWYSAVIAKRMTMRMRERVVTTMFAADPAFFLEHSPGHISSIVLSQTGVAGGAVLHVIKIISITLLIALYAAIMLVVSVPLTLIAIAFALVVSLVVRSAIAQSRKFGLEAAQTVQMLSSRIVERLVMMRLIKMKAQEDPERERIMDYSDRLTDLSVKQARLGGTIEVTADPLLMLSVFITLYIGIAVLGMTLAQLGLVLFVLSRMNAKVKEFNAVRQAISIAMGGVTMVDEFVAEATAADTIRGGDRVFTGVEESIVLRDAHYTYRDGDDECRAIDGVDMHIDAHSLVAVVGRSGAGKSTLVEALPRLRDLESGAIEYDGLDIREFDVASLRRGVGYLTQTPQLFRDTIRENLTYGMGAVSDDEITHALEAASASFVLDLPNGLETNVGEAGVRLSGGERQRIALARTLLSGAGVIVLDEPTSALDSESEVLIQAALERLRADRTIIVIAHRLATVIAADRIFVIEGGRIAESGTHSELLASEGVYRRLFDSQLIRE